MESVFAPECGRFTWGAESSAETHGLHRRTRGQLVPGDPVGEAGIVLDTRAGASLAADGGGVERDRGEALRRAVDGRGQPGGSGAHHDEVEQDPRDGPETQAEMLRQLPGRRAAQHRRGRDDRRHVGRTQAHAGQQDLRVGGLLQVDPGVRQVGAGGERPQRHGLGGVARPDDPYRLCAVAQTQALPARRQRAEDGVGELRLQTHEATEVLSSDPEHASGLGHAGGEIRPLPGDQVQLPQEATGAERGDDGVAVEARTDHLRPSVEDHEEVVGGVPRPVQDIAAFDRLLLAERAQLGEGVGI